RRRRQGGRDLRKGAQTHRRRNGGEVLHGHSREHPGGFQGHCHLLLRGDDMKKMVVGALTLSVIVAAFGFRRGWFEFATTNGDGKSQARLTFNADRFEQDKDELKKKISDQLKTVQERLDIKRDQSRDLPEDARVTTEKEIEDLAQKE